MMDPTAEVRARLHARARIFIDESSAGRRTTDDFDVLGLDIAAYQADRVPGYARLLAAARVRPREAATLRALPAVPTDAFRFARIAAHAPADDAVVFRTSGTTASARGAHALSTTKTYESAALAWGRWALFCDAPAQMTALVLAPRTSAATESSLGFMIDLFADRFAARTHHLQPTEKEPIEKASLVAAAGAACAAGAPAVVMGTSFAFVHALDALAGTRFALPPGSRAMHTGGFKGRSREVAPDLLRAEIAGAFGIESGAVVGEYGMTELSSQLYEGTLRALRGLPVARAEHGVFVPPPWLRVAAVDPETLAPLPDGQTGILRFEDLANVDGAVAVQTADLGRCLDGAVELFGRASGATPRGCSLAIEELLAR
jgi:Acyl-protein synthetase, LuxE